MIGGHDDAAPGRRSTRQRQDGALREDRHEDGVGVRALRVLDGTPRQMVVQLPVDVQNQRGQTSIGVQSLRRAARARQAGVAERLDPTAQYSPRRPRQLVPRLLVAQGGGDSGFGEPRLKQLPDEVAR